VGAAVHRERDLPIGRSGEADEHPSEVSAIDLAMPAGKPSYG
jgi:hypothetical protein